MKNASALTTAAGRGMFTLIPVLLVFLDDFLLMSLVLFALLLPSTEFDPIVARVIGLCATGTLNDELLLDFNKIEAIKTQKNRFNTLVLWGLPMQKQT